MIRLKMKRPQMMKNRQKETDDKKEQTLTEVSSTETSTTYYLYQVPSRLRYSYLYKASGGNSWSSVTIDGETAQGTIKDGESLSGSTSDSDSKIISLSGIHQ